MIAGEQLNEKYTRAAHRSSLVSSSLASSSLAPPPLQLQRTPPTPFYLSFFSSFRFRFASFSFEARIYLVRHVLKLDTLAVCSLR